MLLEFKQLGDDSTSFYLNPTQITAVKTWRNKHLGEPEFVTHILLMGTNEWVAIQDSDCIAAKLIHDAQIDHS